MFCQSYMGVFTPMNYNIGSKYLIYYSIIHATHFMLSEIHIRRGSPLA